MHSNTQSYKTIVGLTFGLSLLYIFKGYEVLLYIISTLCFLSLLSGRFVAWVHSFLEAVLNILGKVISTVILFCVYFVVLTPLALISKVFGGKDALKKAKPKETNFIEVDKRYSKVSFEKLW